MRGVKAFRSAVAVAARSACCRAAAAGLAAALACALPATASASPTGAALDYAALDSVLTRHVRGGRVDYRALRGNRGPLDRFLARAAAAEPDGWPRDEQVAFWVNVYNARVLEGVIRHPGLSSVLDVGRVLGIPTLAFFREKRESGGRRVSLNDIEHGILRQRFVEPRIHFVINCASASCPELPARALRAATLERDLESATRAFLADTTRNRLPREGPLFLSKIFQWFGEDFVKASGSVQRFVESHCPEGAADSLVGRPVRFLDYDWSLNGDG
jgi:hypothetical protein